LTSLSIVICVLTIDMDRSLFGFREAERKHPVAGPHVDFRRVLPVDALGVGDLPERFWRDDGSQRLPARPLAVDGPGQLLAATVSLLLAADRRQHTEFRGGTRNEPERPTITEASDPDRVGDRDDDRVLFAPGPSQRGSLYFLYVDFVFGHWI